MNFDSRCTRISVHYETGGAEDKESPIAMEYSKTIQVIKKMQNLPKTDARQQHIEKLFKQATGMELEGAKKYFKISSSPLYLLCLLMRTRERISTEVLEEMDGTKIERVK